MQQKNFTRGYIRVALMGLCVSLGLSSMVVAETTVRQPTARVVDMQGKVEVASQPDRWRVLRRAKLLFDGYQVRTGAGATATLQPVQAGAAPLLMAENTVVAVQGDEFRVLKGSPLAVQEESALLSFWENVERRWNRLSRYTTVRRGIEHEGEVATPNRVTLSKDFPTLVFRNAGPSFSYRLKIGDQFAMDIPAVAAAAPFVNLDVPAQTPGEHEYLIEVFAANKQLVYVDSRLGRLTWLDDQESAATAAEHQRLLKDSSTDDQTIGNFLEDKGLTVAALFHYRQYALDNPEETDLLPPLLKCYAEFGLKELQMKEAARLPQLAAAE